jgi:hypothetical protein
VVFACNKRNTSLEAASSLARHSMGTILLMVATDVGTDPMLDQTKYRVNPKGLTLCFATCHWVASSAHSFKLGFFLWRSIPKRWLRMWSFASLGCCRIAMLTGWHGRLSAFLNLRRAVRSVKEVFTGTNAAGKLAASPTEHQYQLHLRAICTADVRLGFTFITYIMNI